MRLIREGGGGKVDRSRCHFTVERCANGTYVAGCVSTRAGYVEVYAEDCGMPPLVQLRVIANGREYMRRYAGKWTHRGIAIVAGRFARWVSE